MSKSTMRHLRRSELLQLLIEQKKENERLRDELDKAQRKLNDRQILIDEAGSLAEASLKLNAVFEAAQAAAAQYLENVEMRCFEQRRQDEAMARCLTAQEEPLPAPVPDEEESV